MATKEQGKSTRAQTVLIAFLALAVVALVIVVALLLNRQVMPGGGVTVEATPTPKRNIVITPDNVEAVIEEMESREFVEPGYYTCNMETEWYFPTGDAVSTNARVDNDLGNTNDVYFDIFLSGDEETPIYQSPVIPVGSFLENISLDKPLEAGTHNCVMIYHLVDENQNSLSTLRVAFKIIVAA